MKDNHLSDDNSFIHAKKSLGQNFLISEHALDTIVEAGKITKDDIVIEVGPGKGILTKKLLAKAKQVIAIEKDDRLIPVLQDMFRVEIGKGAFILIHGDGLHFSPAEYNLQPSGYKVIANIPYYITGHFFRKFFEEGIQPNTMVVMVQKEVAERIARAHKESILSLSVKAYGTPKYIHTVSRSLFRPVPNVDSAILAVYDINKDYFDSFTEERFFDIIKAAFAHKRKKLASNIIGVELTTKEKIEKAFSEIPLSIDSRAEDLTLPKWKALISKI